MSYSQNNEEQIIIDHFADFVGTLLSFGENDGRTLSNTLALIEKGWGGDLVEASQKAFERLLFEHEGDERVALHNFAIADYDGEIEFSESGELLGSGDVALVSSTKKEEMDRWTSLNMAFNKIIVPCKTFETFLKGSMYKKYDFISIDIEGMELEVLPQMDFNELGTRLICVEWNTKDKDKFDGIILPFGLKLIHQNAENLIYGK